jgi:hypothetical protein
MVKKAAGFFLAFLTAGAFGTPVVIQPGPEGADTYAEYNETVPHGDDPVLRVRRGQDEGGFITCRTYIRFDLSEYSGITITRAELRFWSVYGGESSNPIVAREVSNVWNEATLIWANQPMFGGPKYYLNDEGDYCYADITPIVYNWVTLGTPNNGTVVKFEDEAVPNDGIVFYSGDNADYPDKRPALLIWSPQLGVEPTSFGAVKAAFK